MAPASQAHARVSRVLPARPLLGSGSAIDVFHPHSLRVLIMRRGQTFEKRGRPGFKVSREGRR